MPDEAEGPASEPPRPGSPAGLLLLQNKCHPERSAAENPSRGKCSVPARSRRTPRADRTYPANNLRARGIGREAAEKISRGPPATRRRLATLSRSLPLVPRSGTTVEERGFSLALRTSNGAFRPGTPTGRFLFAKCHPEQSAAENPPAVNPASRRGVDPECIEPFLGARDDGPTRRSSPRGYNLRESSRITAR